MKIYKISLFKIINQNNIKLCNLHECKQNSTSACRLTKMYSLYHHSYSTYLFHIIKQLLTFMEVNTGLYWPHIHYDIAFPRSGNIMNMGSI